MLPDINSFKICVQCLQELLRSCKNTFKISGTLFNFMLNMYKCKEEAGRRPDYEKHRRGLAIAPLSFFLELFQVLPDWLKDAPQSISLQENPKRSHPAISYLFFLFFFLLKNKNQCIYKKKSKVKFKSCYHVVKVSGTVHWVAINTEYKYFTWTWAQTCSTILETEHQRDSSNLTIHDSEKPPLFMGSQSIFFLVQIITIIIFVRFSMMSLLAKVSAAVFNVGDNARLRQRRGLLWIWPGDKKTET